MGVRSRAVVLTLRLRAGFPRWVARELAAQGLRGRVVVAKQGVLGVITPAAYLRFTDAPKAKARLADEVANWRRLHDAGFGDIIARFMEIRELEHGMVVSVEPLAPIEKESHLEMMAPLVRRLAAASAPAAPEKLPDSIAAGLALAREIGVANLPEGALLDAFSRPLLTGYSHQDLHWRNVLQRKGEPVLIDLKKCQAGRLLCLDILNMACLSLAATNGANVVSQAHEAHRRGWRDADLAPILSLVDLPRSLWGPAYVLHVAGLYRLRQKGATAWGEEMLFRRALEQDWRADALAP